MRIFWVALASLLMASSALADSVQQDSALPPLMASAGVTQAEWSAIRAEVSRQARRARVSEAALMAAAAAAGANLVRSGRFDAPSLEQTIFEQLSDQADQIAELQRRLDALTGDVDPEIAQAFAYARVALNEGQFADADRLLAEVEQGDLAAMQQADAEAQRRRLRAGETIGSRGQVAYIQADYIAAADFFARAAATFPQSAIEQRWRYAWGQANALGMRGFQFAEPERLSDAARLFEQIVLPLAPRETRPADWATTQTGLGVALRQQAERGGAPEALAGAVEAFEAALTVRTREADANSWAQSQFNLGNALLMQSEHGAPGALERAMAALEAALSVWTPESDPYNWALTQSNLGNALMARGRGGEPGAFERAAAAYEAALLARPRGADSDLWVGTQANLLIALEALSEHGAPGARERAIATYEAELSTRTRESDPVTWARLQNIVGYLLLRQSEYGASGAIERSVAAYEAALSASPRAANAALWAQAQMNLAQALQYQGALMQSAPGAAAVLDRAVAAYEAALTVRTKETDPYAWASTQTHLAAVFVTQAHIGVPGALERAVEAYEAALTVWTRVSNPGGWAQTENDLGDALRLLGGSGALERAVVAYQAALTVRTREANAFFWAMSNYNLALAYKDLGRAADAHTAVQNALAGFEQIGDAYWIAQTRNVIAQASAH